MLASASQLERAILCPASSILPRVERDPGEAARRGTLAHALITSDLRGWEKPNVGRYRIKYDLEALRVYLGSPVIACELAMTWDAETREATVLGENLGRDYNAPDGLLCATADVVAPGLVADIKTGQPTTPAKINWQLKLQAVMVASAFGYESVKVALAYLGRDGSWTFDEAEFGPLALDAIADDLALYVKQAKAAEKLYEIGWDPQTRPSEAACKWCSCECGDRIQ